MKQVVGAGIAIVDSAETTARAVHELLDRGELNAPALRRGGSTLIATDGAARFARVGSVFYGEPVDVHAVEIVDL